MLKPSVALVSFLITIGLGSLPKVSVAAEPPIKLIYINPDSITQLKRLEISLSRRQLTLYSDNLPIKTYPIAVGRSGWETPMGNFKVIEKLKNPRWINPLTKESIPGGDPENPLGNYWIGFWTNGKQWIGFHGTPNPNSVGTAASHGCIQMYNKDIEDLFHQVTPGTPVNVVK